MLNRVKKHVRFILNKGYTRKAQIQQSAYPYTDTRRMTSIDTGLKGRWKYSPLFCQPISDTYVKLTGSRSKDYKLAEGNVNVVHIPKVNVWHHVWEKNQSGEYRMQLVDYNLHKGSCPHAGGCKLWCLENRTIYRSRGSVYVSRHLQGHICRGKTVCSAGMIRDGQETDPYSDYVIDYIFDDEEETSSLKVHKFRNSLNARKRYRLWGLDPYGNMFYSDADGNIIFIDHETWKLTDIGLNEKDILK